MKILMVTGSTPPMKCGVGDYTLLLSRHLAKSHQVTVVTSIGAQHINLERLKVIPVFEHWKVSNIFKFLQILLREKPDLVHVQFPTQGYGNGRLPYLIPLVSWVLRKKVVQTWHEIYRLQDLRYIFPIIIPPSGLVVVRPNYLEKLSKFFNIFLLNKTFKIIPNGSSIPQSGLDEPSALALRKKVTNNDNPKIVTFFGFFYEHKGVEDLFEICDPKLHNLLLIGELNSSSPYHEKILRLASDARWNGKVFITGFLNDKEAADYLRISDACIFPFRDGAGVWNTSIQAAVKNGCRVITTTKDLPQNKENIKYTFVNDIEGMKQCLLKVLSIPFRLNPLPEDIDEWQEISKMHSTLYQYLFKTPK